MDCYDVEKLHNIAYVNAQVACAIIEAMGMQAHNLLAQRDDRMVLFNKSDFDNLIEKYCIHHNAVLTELRGGL